MARQSCFEINWPLVSIFVKNQSYNWFVPFLKESTKISLNKFFWSVMYWQTVIMQTSKIQANQDPMKYYKWHFVKQLEWLHKTLQTTWKQRNSGFSSFILIHANLDLRNSFLKSRVVWFDKYSCTESKNGRPKNVFFRRGICGIWSFLNQDPK